MRIKQLYLLTGLAVFTAACMAQTPSTTSKPAEKRNYLHERAKLVAKDHQNNFDRQLSLDSTEQVLNEKLVALRTAMSQQYKDQHFFPPARYFFQSQQHIEETKLFEVLKKMPKGGILHLHGAASGDAAWVVQKTLSMPNAYIYWGSPDTRHPQGQIRFFNEGQQPQGFVKAAQLNLEIPDFGSRMHSLLTFDTTMDGDSVDIWGEFEKIFNRLYGFVSYQPVFKSYFERAFLNLTEDGIQHVELRGIFNELYDLQNDAGYYTTDSTINYFQEAAAAIRKKYPEFTLKVIYTDLRFKGIGETREKLIKAFELRKKYPNFVTGYDLVAEEDAGNSTLYFLDNWMLLDSLEDAYEVNMPLYLHDGESNWVSIDNLYDAVLLNSHRIGHGFNLFRFPNLLEEIKSRDICLEINPISNQILGFIRDLRMHPGSTYLRRGVPCVISSDDPLIFGYKGLSYDFWEVFMAWELDLKALKQLALNSLIYSGLSENEKQLAAAHFHKQWQSFVQEALTELAN